MRLIDADKLREEWLYGGANERIYDTNDFLNSIDEQPSVDAVAVVRCKDCKNWEHGDCYRQELTKPDDFCSYGERKEDWHGKVDI